MRRYKSISLRRHKQNDKIENAINEPIIMMQDEQNKKQELPWRNKGKESCSN